MPLTARIPAGWQRRIDTGEKDPRGTAVHTFSDPIPVLVFAISPTGSSESTVPSQSNRVITTVDVLAPTVLVDTITEARYVTAAEVSAFDRFTVDGRTFEVDGEAQDLTKGPFEYAPGVVIKAKRVST